MIPEIVTVTMAQGSIWKMYDKLVEIHSNTPQHELEDIFHKTAELQYSGPWTLRTAATLVHAAAHIVLENRKTEQQVISPITTTYTGNTYADSNSSC